MHSYELGLNYSNYLDHSATQAPLAHWENEYLVNGGQWSIVSTLVFIRSISRSVTVLCVDSVITQLSIHLKKQPTIFLRIFLILSLFVFFKWWKYYYWKVEVFKTSDNFIFVDYIIYFGSDHFIDHLFKNCTFHCITKFVVNISLDIYFRRD